MVFGALSVKGRALRYLAQREHSRAELERKLARHMQDQPQASAAEQIRAALDELVASGLLSEARAAESVLTGQGARYGTHRLKQTLRGKGLAPELVAATLLQARATELERARAVQRRRFGGPPGNALERARQARFLVSRGFDTDVARSVVRAREVPEDTGDTGDTEEK